MSNDQADVSAKLAAPYQGPSSAVVVLLAQDEQEHVTLFGDRAVAQPCAPEDVVFEVGSITKVFTALLLARLTVDGDIDPNRPIGESCPAFSGAPASLTPRRLASHTSGLPRLHVPMWKAVIGGVGADPYADFDRDDLVAWVRDWRPSQPPHETSHAYSNLGFGLLGEVLAVSLGRPYPDLLQEKVLEPLGLNDTAIALTDDQRKRFAQPRATSGKPVVPWTFQAIAGAGALRSTARDLARFSGQVAAAMDTPTTPIARAIASTAQPVVGLGPKGDMQPMAQCLGWLAMVLDPSAPRVLFHDGGTAGSTSALYVCPQKRAAIVILANRGVAAGLLSNLKLMWSNLHGVASDHFASL
ncbi:MAG: serine hydrolase domain-containing protein [Pseudomonadota bacterium]